MRDKDGSVCLSDGEIPPPRNAVEIARGNETARSIIVSQLRDILRRVFLSKAIRLEEQLSV